MSDINILIVGETGVGKSTFVNAFANYVNFDSLQAAADCEDIFSLIPSKFSIMDDNFEPQEIRYGRDENECDIQGASATIHSKMYRFPFEKGSIVLIDTPGVGDTNGIQRDEENLQNLLAQIAELRYLHAILILLKPNDSRVSVLFQYCIKQLLSSLEKSASSNIVFLFTNSRGTFYKPGDTVAPLRAVLRQIQNAPPHVAVPFNKTNTFCVDNEAFRFLIAKKNNISFTDDELKEFGESWNRSANEIRKMLDYIISLKPHNIKDTVSVNASRTLIFRLSKPLAEISQSIADNIKNLKGLCKLRDDKSLSIEKLREKLIVKRMGLRITEIENPRTVCAHDDCVTRFANVNNSSAVYYKQVCHEGCRVRGAEKDVIGDRRLSYCRAMQKRGGNCKHCGHHFTCHMRIFYNSEPYEYQAEDEIVNDSINTSKKDKEDIEMQMRQIENLIEQYKSEQIAVQESMAKFTHFLKHNAITPINDAYKDYMLYFINTERKKGSRADRNKIEHFEQVIREYEERVNLLENEYREKNYQEESTGIVSSEEIKTVKERLCALPIYGETIKEALEIQNIARRNAQLHIKYVNPRKGIIAKTTKFFGSLFL